MTQPQVLPMGRLMPSPGLFVDRTEKSVVIGGLMELSGAEATLARALSIQKTINLTWTQTFSDGYAVRCNIAVRYRGPGSGASNVTQIQAARIRKICGSVKSSSEAATIRTGVDLLAVSDLGQRTTLRVIFAQMPRVRRVLAAIKELRGERMSTVRMLLVAAGALTAGSVTWVLWGLFTPGDYFAGGSPGVWVTLAVAGFAGAIAAGRVRSRWAAALLLVSALLCSAFWLVVPDAWWASSPPPRPPTPIMR